MIASIVYLGFASEAQLYHSLHSLRTVSGFIKEAYVIVVLFYRYTLSDAFFLPYALGLMPCTVIIIMAEVITGIISPRTWRITELMMQRERECWICFFLSAHPRATSGGSIITPRDATCLPLRLGHFSACCFCGDHHQLE